MRSFTLVSALSLLLFALVTLPSASAAYINSTLESRSSSSSSSSGSYETCASVSGNYFGSKFNFGCLCTNDIDEYCSNNGINSVIKALINAYIQAEGTTKWYPANAQPTCDGNGGYTCGSLTKTSSGCSSTTCASNQCASNGGCCPRGQTYSNGKCCGTTGCSRSGSTCTPAMSCKTYTSNGICCASGTSGWTGYNTVCCPSGQSESGSTGTCVCPAGQKKSSSDANTCVSICDTGYSYSSTTGKCVPTCDTANGYTLKTGSSGTAMCCKSGHTACSTVCCAAGTTEVGNTGVCCSSGSTVSNGKCVSPTGTSKSRRGLNAEQIQLAIGAETTYGLEANHASALCPKGMAACPIPGRLSSSDYECLDSLTDLTSCGGCASLGQGQDCTAIPGAKWMGCNSGVCEVYSCKAGWTQVNGTSCERA